jgi:hypothetical protein
MVVRFVVAAFALAAVTPVYAQRSTTPNPPKTEVMSCDELLKLRDDRRRWDQVSQVNSFTDMGWAFRLRRIVALDETEKETTSGTVGSLAVAADLRHTIGAVIVPRNSLVVPYGVLPMKFSIRWIAAKPVPFAEKAVRCSPEETRTAENGKDAVFGIQLSATSFIDNDYALIGYDDRQNVLFTALFEVRPRVGQSPPRPAQSAPKVAATAPQVSDASENSAALSIAYKRALLIEKCSELGAHGQPLSRVRELISQIETTAGSLKIDTKAARQKAQSDIKSDLEMFDMIAAMGAMNFQQRSSLTQFCAMANMELLDVSKHFAGIERTIPR